MDFIHFEFDVVLQLCSQALVFRRLRVTTCIQTDIVFTVVSSNSGNLKWIFTLKTVNPKFSRFSYTIIRCIVQKIKVIYLSILWNVRWSIFNCCICWQPNEDSTAAGPLNSAASSKLYDWIRKINEQYNTVIKKKHKWTRFHWLVYTALSMRH